jgi:hypothetical protein
LKSPPLAKLKRIYAPRLISDHIMVQEDFERLHKFLLETDLTFTLLAHQLHEMSRPVDQEEVAGIVEILSFEVFCPEPQLDVVVAYPTGIHHALAEVQRDLLRWSEGQYYGLWRWGHGTWLDHCSTARQLPRLFCKRGNAGEGDDE